MATSIEGGLQGFIHSLEQGRYASLVRGFVIAAVILGVMLVYLGWKFRGFNIPEAMDQAQVARQISRGQGWSTQFIRPLAVWQLEQNQKPLPAANGNFPDTFNAPLPPHVNALHVRWAGKMEFKQGEYVAPAEKFIVATSMLCFLGAVGLGYLLLRRLFDVRLAFWASVFTLSTDLCWQYTLSGLPQMLMLLLFTAALYTLLRAIESHLAIERADGNLPPAAAGDPVGAPSTGGFLGWLGATGALLGLLTLSHGVALWIFLGALVFSAAYFRRRGAAVLVLLLAFALVCAPWVVRLYQVSGTATGLAGYTLFDGLAKTTAQRMRAYGDASAHDVASTQDIALLFFRTKLQDGVTAQLARLSDSLGGNLIALGFFVCLLHSFWRREVNPLRPAVLLMWIGAVLGMSLLGLGSEPSPGLNANQFGVLFLPIMLSFGLAFVLVIFSRSEAGSSSVGRLALFSTLFLVSAAALISTLLPRNSPPFQYPPYFEPAINRLGPWMQNDEIIASDMPWAVAWYADRKSLWIPDKLVNLMGLSDNARLPGTVAGLFLTPFSRNTPLFTGVLKGEYSEYQSLILGRADVPGFPFRDAIPLMGDPTVYLFYSDSRRWDKTLPSASADAAKDDRK